jgi:hypothetical protein
VANVAKIERSIDCISSQLTHCHGFPSADVSFQLFLGALSIGPWLLLVIYNVLLYFVRVTLYDMPVIGGEARNRPRPRAPN